MRKPPSGPVTRPADRPGQIPPVVTLAVVRFVAGFIDQIGVQHLELCAADR